MGSLTGTLHIGVAAIFTNACSSTNSITTGLTARSDAVRLIRWERYDDVHRGLGRAKQLIKDGRAPRKSPCWNAAIRSGKTEPQSGTRGWGRVRVGMLRLRSEMASRSHCYAGMTRQRAGPPAPHQLPAGMPPYFCSQFNSSRTLILPCQGFLLRLWPSPGKTSRALGMPSE